MKNLKITLVAAAVSSLLLGCSGDDYDLPVNENNVAPTVNGDISVTVGEKDQFQFVDLLEGTVDLDGDFLSVENISPSIAEIEAMPGVDIDGNQLILRPSELIDSLNTGDTATMVFTFDVSDGALSTARTATVNVTGEDFAPQFEDLTLSATKFDTLEEATFSLLDGVVDADNDELSVMNFVSSEGNMFDIASVSGTSLVLDIPSIESQIEIGSSVSLNFTYEVSDGSNTLPRNLTINVLGVISEPVAPETQQEFSATLTTNSPVMWVDYASPTYTLELNGEPINVDLESIMPLGSAPEFAFSRSSGTTVVIDPIDFAQHMEIGETETFEYMVDIDDGVGGHVVSRTITLDITREVTNNLISNGGFDSDNLDSWTSENAGTATVTTINGEVPIDGSTHLATLGGGSLTQSFNIVPNASYVVQVIDEMGEWGRIKLFLNGGSEDLSQEFGRLNGPVVQQYHAYSFNTSADELAASLSMNIGSDGGVTLDNVSVTRYSQDLANNLIASGTSKTSFDFEEGVGEWMGSIAVITNEESDHVIGGNQSASVTVWGANLLLPAGTIKNGKKYLLSTEIRLVSADQGNWVPARMELVLPGATNDSDTVSLFADSYANAGNVRGQDYIFMQEELGTSKFEKIIDVDNFTTKTDWENEEILLRVFPDVWAGASEMIIDNVTIVEID